MIRCSVVVAAVMERGCTLIVLVVLRASYLDDGQEGSCPQGRFGDSCSYSCNCDTSCNNTTGVCTGDCDDGWREGNGSSCQKKNVAYGKTVLGSGDRDGWTAEKAVDGNRDKNIGRGSCYHSTDYPTNWWVNLAAEYRTHSVRIYNRAGFPQRLASCTISVGPDSNSEAVCYTFPPNREAISDVTDLTCNGTGRFFIIRNPGRAPNQDDTLNICEVEIYVCSEGTYGPNCSEFCHCLNSTCDHVTGICPGDCRPGRKGTTCSTSCSYGESYGINCNRSCSDRKCNSKSSSCDRRSGSCDSGCRAGWRESDCTKKCDSLYYGNNCSRKCKDRSCALNNSSCNHVTGACDTGACQAGWKGDSCTEQCDNGKYGPNCEKKCSDRHCNGTSGCPRVNGSCTSGCDKGWARPDCSECTTGFHGPGCIECGHCAVNSTCDSTTGECPSGCLEGYSGLQCKESVGNGSSIAGGLVGTLLLLLLAVIIAVVVYKYRGKHPRSARGHHAVFNHEERQKGDDNVYMNVDVDAFPIYATPNLKAKKGKSGIVDTLDEDSKSVDTLNADTRSVDTLEVESEEEGRAPDVPEVNYYNMEDIASRHIVPVADLETTVRNMAENPEMAEEEFKRLPDGFVHPCEESRKPDNTKKNRFKGYYPYDHNRVVLEYGGHQGDYINASFLNSYKKERYYIAAQGPYKPNIVDDFWRMIWQEGVKVVVMVTSLVEGGRMKCLQYWPDKGTQEYGDIAVTMETVNELSDFTIRKLRVCKKKESMNRQIYHFNFTSWPDHGVPNTFSLLEFMWRVQDISGRPAEPIIVHCSAGIGRTGTYIAIESLLDQAAAEGFVDVVSFVSNMRGQRKGMIQTSDQYEFVYRAVTTAVLTGDTSMDSDTVRNIQLTNLGTVTMGNRSVEQHLQELESVAVKVKKKRTVLIPSYRCRYGFFLLVEDVDKDNLWAHVSNSNSCTVITLGKSAKGCMPTGNDPVETTRHTATLKSSNVIADDVKLDTINSGLKDGSGSDVRHYRLKTGVHSPNVGVMIDSLLQWTSDPDRQRCTIISKSITESRLLVLLMNIASRLQNDGRVDVISNMRRLYREVGQTFFTEADVKYALKFAQIQIDNLGLYANL